MTSVGYDCTELAHTGWKEAELITLGTGTGGSRGAAVTKDVQVQEGYAHLHYSQSKDWSMKTGGDSAEVTS